jgi:hypothetical protein
MLSWLRRRREPKAPHLRANSGFFVRSAPKSLCPSGRNATGSPSISALSTGGDRAASAILGNRSVKSVPCRVHQVTPVRFLAGDQPVAVVLDLVNPLSPFRRIWVLPRRQGAPSAINRQPRPSTQSIPKISRTATVSSDCRRCVLGRRGVGRTCDFIGRGELFIDGWRDEFGGGGEEGRGSRNLHGFLGEVLAHRSFGSAFANRRDAPASGPRRISRFRMSSN